MNFENISIGIGKTIVEFFSEEMVARVCRYLARAKEIMIAQSHGWQTRNKKDKSSETSLYPYMNSCELYCVQTWAGEQQGTRRWCLKPLWELATLSALLQRQSPASQQNVNSWISFRMSRLQTITFALASLVASASAAMALCKFCGKRTSFTWSGSTVTLNFLSPI